MSTAPAGVKRRSWLSPRRPIQLLALGAILAPSLLVFAPSASADTVSTVGSVTASGTDTFTAGGSTSVSYTLSATDTTDPVSGCDATGNSPATAKLVVPSGVTATWDGTTTTSTSFTGCGSTYAATFRAAVAGDYPVSVVMSGGKTGSTYAVSGAAFTLHVKAVATDTTGPVLTLPANQSAEATSSSGAVVSYTTSAFDAGDNKATTVSCAPASGSTFPIGTTTVTCSSSDSKGNKSTGTFTVTVTDSTGPVLSLSDTTAEATSASGAKVSFAATANDAVDGSTAVSCTPASGSTFPLGATTVPCSSTDSRGNKTSGSLKVTVQDTTAPSLTLPTTTVAEATGASGAAVSYTVSASDLVDGTVTPSCDKPSGSTFALGDTRVNCSATDKAGNKATGSFTITVGDHTAPTLNLTDKTAEATAPDGADVTYSATANDTVDGAIIPQCTPGSGSTFSLGTTAVNCSASDSRSNTAMGTLHITVQDTTPPTLTLADETDEATSANGASVNYTASASDLVSGTVAVSCDKAVGATFPLGATLVSCTATDKAGNVGKGSFTVTVKDRTAPILVLSNQSQEATSANGAAVPFDATATDLVDGTDPVTCTPASGSTFALGDSTVSCTSTDKAGNIGNGSFKVTVTDVTPPAITVESKTVEATGPTGAKVDYTATAKDLVDGNVAPSCDVASGSTFALGATTVTCSATDSHHNFASKAFTIRVVDTTGPEIKTTDSTAEATGPTGAAVTFGTSATDLVDGPTAVSCDKTSGDTFPLGTTMVSCTSTDSHSNQSTATFNVTVQDTTPPALQLKDQTLEATGPSGAPATYAPTATDLVDGNADTVSCDTPSGTTFPLATTTVTCHTADAAGNKAAGSFTITVGDHTAPALSLTDASAEATKPAGADVTYSASASDIVDGVTPVACSPASGSTFPIAVTAVGCSSSDSRGNTAKGSLKVTVTDHTPPSVTVTDQKAEATGADGAAVTFPATATDIVDGTDAVTCDHTSGSTFPLGVTTVSCSATDAHANKGTASFTVTVKDTTAPVLTLGDKSAEATGPNGAAVSFSPTAADVVDGTDAVTCDATSGSTFALGSTTVHCFTKDKAGNPASGSFTVTVVDTTAPLLSVKDVTAEATSAAGAPVTYTATANDLVDGATTVTCTPASGSTFKLGDTAVSCSTADSHGNGATSSFTVTVQDTTAPALSKPVDIALTATSAAGAPATYSPTATDAVDGSVTATCTPASGSTFALGTTQVTCTATDKAGNKSASQMFNVAVTVPWSNVLAPLNSDGSSVYKIGSTIPVKFQLTGTAAGISNLPAKLYYAKVSNSLPGTEVEAISTSAADSGNQFRYDATAKQYIFNLSTKGFTEGTYQLRVDLGDGVSHTVNITSKK